MVFRELRQKTMQMLEVDGQAKMRGRRVYVRTVQAERKYFAVAERFDIFHPNSQIIQVITKICPAC